MAKTIEEKIVKEAAQYVWGRIKVIILMIILLIVVKEHPGWDVTFAIILILQAILGVLVVLRVPKKVTEAKQKESKRQRQSNYQERFYEEFNKRSNRRVSFVTDDISPSAKILGINIIQDDEDTIKKKYRKLAMKWHPDKFATDTKENQEIAKRNFQKVSGAYNKVKKYKNIT